MNELMTQLDATSAAAPAPGARLQLQPARGHKAAPSPSAATRRPGSAMPRWRRSVRAALHAAEFAEWQASGGDFLCSSRGAQPTRL